MSDRILAYRDAVREATELAMTADPSVIVLGMGVNDVEGIYGTTRGLRDRFGADRVFDTPVAEEGMTGVAVGAALGGLRPIHVHIRMDFLLLAMNQIVNVAAKARYMYGGAVSVPLVIRAIIGRSWGQGAQHSQGLHSLFMHIPGLRVVAPVTPYDAKGALLHAIGEDDPVIVVEHRMLHGQEGQVPEGAYGVAPGQARILTRGADITIVAISYMAVEALRAHALLADAGIDAEVIDPVWLSPLDIDTIVESAGRTGCMLVVDNGWTMCGASAEIVAAVAESGVGRTPVRMQRMGFAPVTCPTARPLETAFYPDARGIASAAHRLVRGSDRSWPSDVPSPERAAFRGPF